MTGLGGFVLGDKLQPEWSWGRPMVDPSILPLLTPWGSLGQKSKDWNFPPQEFSLPALLILRFSSSRDPRNPRATRAAARGSKGQSVQLLLPARRCFQGPDQPPPAFFHLSSVCFKKKMHHSEWGWGGSQLCGGVGGGVVRVGQAGGWVPAALSLCCLIRS